jgi:16S rRNA C1402 (ribose-2'-O) methylase RsmI
VAVFFESPHRIGRTIGELSELVKRPIIIGREVTKINESLVLRQNNELNVELSEIGEFVVVVEKVNTEVTKGIDTNSVADIFDRLTNCASIDDDEAIAIVSQRFNLPKPRVKNVVKKARIEAKRRQNRLP